MATWDRIGAKSTGELPPLVWNWLKSLFAYMEGGVLKVNGTPVNFGNSLPNGGTTGQVLKKQSNADADVAWGADLSVPTGGTTGQVLKKNSDTSGDAAWSTELAMQPGSAMNPLTSKTAARNNNLTVCFWKYTGVDGVDNPVNAVAGDEWIRA
jgi:hypothetical protein